MPDADAHTPSKTPRLLEQVHAAIRLHGYSPRTEKAYVGWIRRYVRFHGMRHPEELAEPEATAFLTHLTVERNVSASTQNQALSAILFLSKGNVESVGDLFAEDFVGRFPGRTLHGRQALVNAVKAHRTSFPDWTEEIKDTIADRDRVVVRFRSRGTNLGEFLGNPPTRNHVEISEVAIFRLSNGKIIEQWVYRTCSIYSASWARKSSSDHTVV